MASWQITDKPSKTFVYKNGEMTPRYTFSWDEKRRGWCGHGRKFSNRGLIRNYFAVNSDNIERLLK